MLYIGVLTNIFHLFPEQDQPSASRRQGRPRGRGNRSPSAPSGSRSPLASRPSTSSPDQDQPARRHFIRRRRSAPAVPVATGKCNGFILFIFFKSNLLH